MEVGIYFIHVYIYLQKIFLRKMCWVVVAQVFNPSTQKAEAGRSLSSRLVWSTKQVPGQPEQHRQTQVQKQNKKVCLKYFLCVWMCACMYLCIPHACVVPLKVRRGPRVPWDWSYKWFCAVIWVLEIELWSSRRATSLICWAISPAPSWRWLSFALCFNGESGGILAFL